MPLFSSHITSWVIYCYPPIVVNMYSNQKLIPVSKCFLPEYINCLLYITGCSAVALDVHLQYACTQTWRRLDEDGTLLSLTCENDVIVILTARFWTAWISRKPMLITPNYQKSSPIHLTTVRKEYLKFYKGNCVIISQSSSVIMNEWFLTPINITINWSQLYSPSEHRDPISAFAFLCDKTITAVVLLWFVVADILEEF